LNEIVEADYAAYVAYLAIRNAMEQGTYLVEDPLLVKLQYLSPSPDFPNTNTGLSSTSTDAPPSWNQGSSISAWTTGACITVSAGGLVALLVWGRNRWTRHRRHIQLLEEDISLGSSPSLIIPNEDDKL
jgi:hypothetical protein